MVDILLEVPDVDLASPVGDLAAGAITLPPGVYLPASKTVGLSAPTPFVVELRNTAGTLLGTIQVSDAGDETSTLTVSLHTIVRVTIKGPTGATGTFTGILFQFQDYAPGRVTPRAVLTYRDLKNDAAAFAERGDVLDNADAIFRTVQRRVARDLNARRLQRSAVLAAEGGVCELPEDFKDVRAAYHSMSKLAYVPPEQIRAMYEYTTSGPPRFFSVEGYRVILAPVPSDDTPTEITFHYFANAPLMTADSDTTELLQDAYDVYVRAAVAEIFHYTMDEQQAAKHEVLYAEAVRNFNAQQTRSWFGVYGGGGAPTGRLIV